jgi:class 3 adenylate cyclase
VQTRFARVEGAHVAYRVVGEGDVDILMFLGESLPVDALDEEPRYARSMRRLASFGRVIVFNRRGVGLSDAPDGPFTHDQNLVDALAVLDAVGVGRAVVFGSNLGGPPAMRFAAEHPDRTVALILANTYARLVQAPDYPIGLPKEVMVTIADRTNATEPDAGDDFDWLRTFAPSVADDDRFRAWWDQAGNRGASPARSRALWQLLIETDAREALPQITAPSLVLGRSGVGGVNLGRYVAENIANAKYVEFPGNDLMWWVADADAYLDEIEAFLSKEVGSARKPQRSLATVLFVDVASSTEEASRLGDQRWRDLLNTYHDLARREIDRFGGKPISTAGDGLLATFDMPADAVRCGQRIASVVQGLAIDVRAGVHTGEIEIVGHDVAGIGVHIASRVQSAAAPGEVWVSRTVTDLVTGSGLAFEDKGEHELKGVPGRWGLFAVRA